MTVRADPEDLKCVRHIRKTMFVRNCVSQLLHLGAFHFNRGSTTSTHEVMVVGVTALPVYGLTVIADDDIDLTELGERLQSPIDRSESDLLALVTQEIVQLLRRPKVVDLEEGGDHGGALLSRSHLPISLPRRRMPNPASPASTKIANAMRTMVGPGGTSR